MKEVKLSLLSLAVFTTLSIAPISSQTAKLTADDAAIIRAALDGVVRPEIARFEHQPVSTPILTFDRTMALCPIEKSIVAAMFMRCFYQNDYSEIAKLSTVFKDELQDPARTQIRTSFLERNKSHVTIPPKAIEGVVLASPAEIRAKYDEKSGRGAQQATISMPGLSSDGRAIVFVSYWCGNVCGYGWFVLLKKSPDGWHTVAKQMVWVS